MENYHSKDSAVKPADPAHTYALVVGIEKYAAGSEWDLEGPAHDALRFANWLCKRGVPADNIDLVVSPLADHANAEKWDWSGRPVPTASRQTVVETLQKLQSNSGDLLTLYWGGHGSMADDSSRRLFFADATSRSCEYIDFDKLLTSLRSDYYSGFRYQILIVDACADYVTDWETLQNMTPTVPPRGRPRTNVEQFVLFAARDGERAKNLTREHTGQFTDELLSLLNLELEGTWPPNMLRLTEQLQNRFALLRNQGLAQQAPTSYWYRDGGSSKGDIVAVPTPIEAPLGMTSTQLRRVRFALQDAFSREELERMVRECLDVRFEAIVADKSLEDQIFALVDWADRHGRVVELIGCAQNEHPGNSALQALGADLELREAVPDPIAPEQTAMVRYGDWTIERLLNTLETNVTGNDQGRTDVLTVLRWRLQAELQEARKQHKELMARRSTLEGQGCYVPSQLKVRIATKQAEIDRLNDVAVQIDELS